jgi:hypothetical protein
MKRNADKNPIEAGGEDSGTSVLETSRRRNGTNTALSSAADAPQQRPEIAVLGWDVRSYRLSLRASKA